MSKDKSGRHIKTGLVASGRPHDGTSYPVSQPVERASTILYPTYDSFMKKNKDYVYGRFGTRSHRALTESLCELEKGDYTHLTPSGLSAITTCLLALAKTGDHILITDSCYDPVRSIGDRFLNRYGIEVEYYDPRAGGDIAALLKPETKAILCESPGSLTFEVQDIPAITAAARSRNVPVVVDNTWSAGYFFNPLEAGATVSIQSITKYIAGHADCLWAA